MRAAGIEPPRARYRQVADDLRQAIARGQFGPGDALPSQPELAGLYHLNQTSISRAMAVLEAEGLVRTEHGRGTYVEHMPAVKHIRHIPPPVGGFDSSFADEMRKASLEARTELVQAETVHPPSAVAQHLDLGAGKQALIAKWRMFADARPVQLAASYIPLSIAGGVDLVLADTGPAGIHQRLAERGYHVTRLVEEVESRRPADEEAEALRISPSQHVLEVLRLARDRMDRTMELTINVFPSQVWRLSYEWSV